jgi:hypothetical protein
VKWRVTVALVVLAGRALGQVVEAPKPPDTSVA